MDYSFQGCATCAEKGGRGSASLVQADRKLSRPMAWRIPVAHRRGHANAARQRDGNLGARHSTN